MTTPFRDSSFLSNAGTGVSFDAGLRAHMLRVFNLMAAGVGLTGFLAYLVANTSLISLIMNPASRLIFMLAPLGFVLVLSFGVNRMTASTIQTLFWAFCATMGISMATIFLAYTQASIASTFFITAATFGAMSLWGYTTRADLSRFGSFLMMGLIGILIASLVNMFMMSPMVNWLISVGGVVVFTGMTAWDVQRIKQTYAEGCGVEANSKLAVMSALNLYLNFINLFTSLLRLLGDRR
jgi:uncharacterized protein